MSHTSVGNWSEEELTVQSASSAQDEWFIWSASPRRRCQCTWRTLTERVWISHVKPSTRLHPINGKHCTKTIRTTYSYVEKIQYFKLKSVLGLKIILVSICQVHPIVTAATWNLNSFLLYLPNVLAPQLTCILIGTCFFSFSNQDLVLSIWAIPILMGLKQPNKMSASQWPNVMNHWSFEWYYQLFLCVSKNRRWLQIENPVFPLTCYVLVHWILDYV